MRAARVRTLAGSHLGGGFSPFAGFPPAVGLRVCSTPRMLGKPRGSLSLATSCSRAHSVAGHLVAGAEKDVLADAKNLHDGSSYFIRDKASTSRASGVTRRAAAVH
eukprot:1127473-Prymnesium_polylepis.1